MNGNKLGKIIVGLRKSKGFTQKQLADELHVSDKSLSNWERGYSLPTIETVYLFSKYFEVNFQDLMKARLEDDKDGNLVQGVIDEFNNMGNKKAKRLKKILFGTLIIIAILIVGLFFVFNYNRFVVYKVQLENSDFVMISGSYIETNQKDTLYLNNINVKGLEIKNTDTVSVDVYVLDNKEEKLINTFSDLDNIHIDNFESYIEFDNLSDYFDKLYLRVTIIDKNNKVQEYTTKMKFIKDFSNSKIYIKDNIEIVKTINKTPEEIKNILLKNDYKENPNNNFIKKDKIYNINYMMNLNKIKIYYEKNGFNYLYTYLLDVNRIEILIYNNNNLEIENYKYDVQNGKVIECITGKCNNYEETLKLFKKEVLYLLK